jgi:hypothetical protein
VQAATQPSAFGPVTIRPGDPRYDGLLRGNIVRHVGRPDEIRVVGSTDQVVRAVTESVRAGRRVAVRSGGHCFENFTTDPAVRVLLDLSSMDEIGYDADKRAFTRCNRGPRSGRCTWAGMTEQAFTTLMRNFGEPATP